MRRRGGSVSGRYACVCNVAPLVRRRRRRRRAAAAVPLPPCRCRRVGAVVAPPPPPLSPHRRRRALAAVLPPPCSRRRIRAAAAAADVPPRAVVRSVPPPVRSLVHRPPGFGASAGVPSAPPECTPRRAADPQSHGRRSVRNVFIGSPAFAQTRRRRRRWRTSARVRIYMRH